MQVEIDPHSGFCGGVIRAIGTAEAFLDAGTGCLYSLGAIVHNEEELSRLEGRGLRAVGKDVLGTPAGPGAGGSAARSEHTVMYAHDPEAVYEDCMPSPNENPRDKKFIPTWWAANASVPSFAARTAVMTKPTRMAMFSTSMFEPRRMILPRTSIFGPILFSRMNGMEI